MTVKKDKKKVSNAVKKYVSRKIDKNLQDYQFNLTLTSPTTSDTTPNFVLLNGIAQGNNNGERKGNKIRMKQLRMRIDLAQNSHGAPSTLANGMVRFIVLYDKQANGALPIATNLLVNGAPASNAHISPFKIETVPSRYVILYDKVHQLQAHGGSTNIAESKFIDINLKSLRKSTFYTGTSGAMANVATGSLIFMHVADTSSGSAYTLDFDAQSTLIYENA